MKRLMIPALAPLLLFVACEQKTAAPAAPTETTEERTVATPANSTTTETAFQHDPAIELTGFYFTQTPVQAGNWKLTSLDIGQPSDFADWEAGKRIETYAPIFLAFDDVTSPTAENELGQTYHKVSLRLLPDGYSVDGKTVRYHASDKRLGEVVLELYPDMAAYKKARSSGPNDGVQKPVFTGSLQIGAERIRNLSFSYHPGE
uniref:hypothetical protein n=1 Tax=uncultured Caulobacter sp. TaxID=158749 RepID=UPI0026002D02|nr:hypothetical protein [uncultured Caulobacter sp.]